MFHYQLYIYIYAKTCNVDIYSLPGGVWVTSDGKYYYDPTKTMLSYFFFCLVWDIVRMIETDHITIIHLVFVMTLIIQQVILILIID